MGKWTMGGKSRAMGTSYDDGHWLGQEMKGA